jgi:predicted RecB family nuclease
MALSVGKVYAAARMQRTLNIKMPYAPDGIRFCFIPPLNTLLTVARESVVLPLPSFSLKVVEDYVGFERKEAEYGGSWAMATFIEATETNDEGKRKELMDKIIAYNREDLEATWAVFEWLRSNVVASN